MIIVRIGNDLCCCLVSPERALLVGAVEMALAHEREAINVLALEVFCLALSIDRLVFALDVTLNCKAVLALVESQTLATPRAAQLLAASMMALLTGGAITRCLCILALALTLSATASRSTAVVAASADLFAAALTLNNGGELFLLCC